MLNLQFLRYPFLFGVPVMKDLAGLRGLFTRPYQNWQPGTPVVGHMLSRDPIIFCCQPQPWPFGAADYFARRFADKPLVFLVPITMSLERRIFAISLAVQHRRFEKRYPHARMIMLANTRDEERILRGLGVAAQFAPQNMFVNETMYHPLPGRERTFDAIYNAQLAPFKRHDLARLVPSCAYVTKMFSHWPAQLKRQQLDKFVRTMPLGHAILNDVVPDGIVLMSHVAVNEAMASAHVGLCLSKLEGAMYASIEYLLAGLPVVSTRSRGGRDTFFHPDTTLIVDDDPRAVRDGVAAMKSRNIPPDYVRATTMKLVAEERTRFNAFISGLRNGHGVDVETGWSFDYYHKLARSSVLSDFEAQLAAGA